MVGRTLRALKLFNHSHLGQHCRRERLCVFYHLQLGLQNCWKFQLCGRR